MLQLNQVSAPSLALNSGALAIGSTASQIAIATAVNYLFRGVFGQRATSASIAFPANSGSYTTVPAGFNCSFAIVVDPANSNAVSGIQGPIVPAGDPVPVAAIPENRVCIGAVRVVNATNPFIPGTTNLNATGVTSTYFNLAANPGYSL
jgi:hypothetical protein